MKKIASAVAALALGLVLGLTGLASRGVVGSQEPAKQGQIMREEKALEKETVAAEAITADSEALEAQVSQARANLRSRVDVLTGRVRGRLGLPDEVSISYQRDRRVWVFDVAPLDTQARSAFTTRAK